MIDLEKKGKEKRQFGKNLFLSDHNLSDVTSIKKVLKNTSLMVRINSLNENSTQEIGAVIDSGANYIMLPYFHKTEEVLSFCHLVNGRAKIILLAETSESVDCIGELAKLKGVDEIHIGLNDLRICRRYKSIFEPIYDGTIEHLCNIMREANKPYGFGGIGKLSKTDLPVNPERVLAEQVHLGCSNGWLGRTFRENTTSIGKHTELASEIKSLRDTILKWQLASEEQHQENRAILYDEIKSWENKLSIQETLNV